MNTKAKKEDTSKKEDTKAKAETKGKDAAEPKSASKATKETKKPGDANSKKEEQGGEFREFFIDELKDILWAEKALLKALPKMSKAATGKELASSFDNHLTETEKQIAVVEQVFELMGEKPATKKCDAMESIISDTEKGSAIRDAGLILAAQKVEHYEIATYGTLAAFADAMEEPKVAKLLRSVLRDEKDSDKKLTALALESVNEAASEE